MPMYNKKKFQVYHCMMSPSFKFKVTALLLSAILIVGCGRKTPERLLNDAQEAAKQYDFPLAITKMEQFIERYPHDPRAVKVQFQIGGLHMKMGQFDLAIQEFQKVIQKYPATGGADTQAEFAIANCYVNEKKFDKAQEIWTKLSMDTAHPLTAVEAKFNIAKSYEMQTNWAGAEKEYQEISMDTTHPLSAVEAKFAIAKAYEMQKNWVGAEKEYREAIAMFPMPVKLMPKGYPKEADERGVVDATQALAMAVYRQGKTDKAIEIYKSLQTMYPKNEYVQGVGIWSNVIIGDIYTQEKQSKKAAESYQKALGTYAQITTDKLVPDKACWAMTKLGEIYELHLMDTTKAVALYKEAITDFPKTQTVRYAQNALMRVTRPPMARDTTRMNPAGPAIDTTKKK
jgi:tetratricopeptide (TPR) repeat protein